MFEKLKNPHPQKEEHEDLVNKKEGFFGGIDALLDIWTSWTSIWIPLMP